MPDFLSVLDEVFGGGESDLQARIDEMAGMSEEDIKERYNAYAQCKECAQWTYLIGSKETYGDVTRAQECEHCKSHNFDSQSVTSRRSFNVVTAKRRKPKVQQKRR